jgi:hypothetical protein
MVMVDVMAVTDVSGLQSGISLMSVHSYLSTSLSDCGASALNNIFGLQESMPENGASLAAELAAAAAPAGQTSSRPDWEVDPGDLQLCVREDGTNWKLGSGAYGQARPKPFPITLAVRRPCSASYVCCNVCDDGCAITGQHAARTRLVPPCKWGFLKTVYCTVGVMGTKRDTAPTTGRASTQEGKPELECPA